MFFPYVATNPLSPLWSIAFDAHVPAETRSSARWKLPGAYLLGMIGYAAAVPVRAAELVLSLVKLPCLCCQDTFLDRIKQVAIAILAILGGIVGIVCPPLAYKIDEALQRDHPERWADQPILHIVQVPNVADVHDLDMAAHIARTNQLDEEARDAQIDQARAVFKPVISFFNKQALPLLKKAIPNEINLLDEEESNLSYQERLKAGLLLVVKAGKGDQFLDGLNLTAPQLGIPDGVFQPIIQVVGLVEDSLASADGSHSEIFSRAYQDKSPLYSLLTQFAGTMMAPSCGPLLNILFSDNGS